MKIGVQLYTLRQYGKTASDLAKTFAKVKEMGYDTVQYSGCATFPDKIGTKELKKIADDNGINICLTHVSSDRIFNQTEKLAEEHLAIGCPTIGLGSMPQEPRTDENALKKFIDDMNEACDKLSSFGLGLAYHNHALEFKKLGDKILFNHLLDGFDKRIFFTMDTYWVKCAKEDPIEWMKKLSGRIKDLHIKDWSDKLGFFEKFVWRDGCKMCPIGAGKLDFQAIFAQGKAQGVQTALIELDIAKKPFDALQQSTDYLNGLFPDKSLL